MVFMKTTKERKKKAMVLTEEERKLCLAVIVLSHPISAVIAMFLKKNGRALPEEIAKAIGAEYPSVSLHLLELSEVGLVKSVIKPTTKDLEAEPGLLLRGRYRLNLGKVRDVLEKFQKLF